jgi:hypothetical protein
LLSGTVGFFFSGAIGFFVAAAPAAGLAFRGAGVFGRATFGTAAAVPGSALFTASEAMVALPAVSGAVAGVGGARTASGAACSATGLLRRAGAGVGESLLAGVADDDGRFFCGIYLHV